MDHPSFDALARRTSLVSLGMVGLGTLLHPSLTAAKKNKSDKKAKKKCRTQVAQCTALITIACVNHPTPTCQNLLDCCDFAGICDFTGFLNCLAEGAG